MSRHQSPSPTDNRPPGPSGQRKRQPTNQPHPGADATEDVKSTPGGGVPPIKEERGDQVPDKLPAKADPPQRA